MAYAVDPDETTEVEVEDATFTIGHVPMGVYRRIVTEELHNQSMARRRAIKRLRDIGDEPSEEAVNEQVWLDPEYREQADRLALEELRWSVRGHSGLRFHNGAEVPFKAATTKYRDGTFPVVSPETLRVYEQSFPRIVQPLVQAISAFNSLSEQEKKVSRSQPSPTEANTSAGPAPAPQG